MAFTDVIMQVNQQLFAKKEEAKTVFLGDYVDRGLDNIKTLKVLIKAKKTIHNGFF